MTDLLQKTENVAKNVADENSQNLTELWRKGELPEGHYYVKDGESMIAEYLDGYFYNNGEPMTSFSGGVDSVLAPVPSYDEWFKIKNLASLTSLLQEKNIECLHRENKLKELLKECVKMNTRLENALWQWNEESELYDENEALENKINEVLNA